ncbi:DUF2798 domain-containing protein [Pseudomaricurvus alkylphenolicus]|uniref:DUF2798 domain-containing protein n=1 Tax=Pseudomaricurvus alkylphenolicus TaxID=1306991 RepID=UPI003B834307
MSAIISLVLTLTGNGDSGLFFSAWMQAWGTAFWVALPSIFIATPIARRVSSLLISTRVTIQNRLRARKS